MLRKLSDPPLKTCPACGQDTYEKQVTAAGFRLKGTGWYATDFRGGGQSAPKSADTAGGGSSSSAPASTSG
ncbi:MAG TPA: zinc ribbon domain-containing protein [Castellaniella sp.]|nr:zinc ribbon domain-containing protein [Castellaniella sp.]HET8702442.1 zinc ribbon domain-containing protein [Castellaniella sp.]